MTQKRLHLIFYFHMHQPYYKNLLTNEYALPWVRLHALKDYYRMVAMLKNYPHIKFNINVVPSLISQLQDYIEGVAEDPYLILSQKKADELTNDEKLFILRNFFSANLKNCIYPNERYKEMLLRRGDKMVPEALQRVLSKFSTQDFLDLQIWFRLVWLDEETKGSYEIKKLIDKGRTFSEQDKEIILRKEKEILSKIIPEYIDAYKKHQIELTTSAFYHPILPLIYNSKIAEKSSQKYKQFPTVFSYPEDAEKQIENAIKYHEKTFGFKPVGIWPSEGAVSEDIIPLFARYGFKYFSSDEDILALSLGYNSLRDFNKELHDPSILYKFYEVNIKGNKMIAFFRDKILSDLISFYYHNLKAEDAAQDFISRLKKIQKTWNKDYEPYVFIIMDGENAWEWYEKNGMLFFDKLFTLIGENEWIKTELIPDCLESALEYGVLSSLYPGSWINHDFSIWIGHPEDNQAWSLLKAAREVVDSLENNVTEDERNLARESLYIAEGSDWFWWFGEEHSSEHDEVFDQLFRTHITNVYTLLHLQPPESLAIPIKLTNGIGKAEFIWPPSACISPIIDGKVTSYFEYLGAGEIKLSYLFSTHRPSQIPIKKIFFGFDKEFIYFRLDFEELSKNDFSSGKLKIHLHFIEPDKISFVVYQANNDTIISILREDQLQALENAKSAFANILEIAIPKNIFSSEKNFHLKIMFYENNALFLEIPPQTFLVMSAVCEELMTDWTA